MWFCKSRCEGIPSRLPFLLIASVRQNKYKCKNISAAVNLSFICTTTTKNTHKRHKSCFCQQIYTVAIQRFQNYSSHVFACEKQLIYGRNVLNKCLLCMLPYRQNGSARLTHNKWFFIKGPMHYYSIHTQSYCTHLSPKRFRLMLNDISWTSLIYAVFCLISFKQTNK